jgi:hypothetical protein
VVTDIREKAIEAAEKALAGLMIRDNQRFNTTEYARAAIAAYEAAMPSAAPNAGAVSEEELRRAVQAHVARRCLVLDHPDVLLGMTAEELRDEEDAMRAALAAIGVKVG